jgi:uncharacterized protein
MAKLPPYVVLVRDLPLDGKRFEIGPELVASWLKGLPMREALGAPEVDPDAGAGTAVLDLYTESANVHATGTFDGYLTVACSRCVNPVKLELHEPIHVSFLPAADMPAEDAETEAEEGVEVGAEDLDVFAYDGEKVDLEPLFREQFVLAIPFAPLCSETCKGLCPQCGIDRNLETCACEAPIDPRLAALKGLKLPS